MYSYKKDTIAMMFLLEEAKEIEVIYEEVDEEYEK